MIDYMFHTCDNSRNSVQYLCTHLIWRNLEFSDILHTLRSKSVTKTTKVLMPHIITEKQLFTIHIAQFMYGCLAVNFRNLGKTSAAFVIQHKKIPNKNVGNYKFWKELMNLLILGLIVTKFLEISLTQAPTYNSHHLSMRFTIFIFFSCILHLNAVFQPRF